MACARQGKEPTTTTSPLRTPTTRDQVNDFKHGTVHRVLVISYETVRTFAAQLAGSCDLLVCDEGHRCEFCHSRLHASALFSTCKGFCLYASLFACSPNEMAPHVKCESASHLSPLVHTRSREPRPEPRIAKDLAPAQPPPLYPYTAP